jgi:TRAP transporter 4TM/12TM fusion protein
MKEKINRTSLRKTLTGSVNLIVVILSVVWIIWQMAIASQLIYLSPQKIRIVHLGFALLMVFFTSPFTARSDLNKVSLIDTVLIVLTLVIFILAYFRNGVLIMMGGRAMPIDIYTGIVMLLLLFEAARRVISPGLMWLALIMLAYALWGNFLSGGLAHTGFSYSRIIRHLMLTGEGVFGFALGVSAEIIIVFITFGSLLQDVGISDYFYDLSHALAGRQRGGPAKVAVISSSLMGMISGETSANVATTGSFTIPLMKRVGYSADFAGAVECAASAGGQILPPVMGATAFMLADTLGIPYIRLATAAILPAILYYVSVFATVHFRAVRKGLKGNAESAKSFWELLKKSYLLLPMVFIVVLMVMNYTPTFSAFWGGIISALVISLFRKDTRITFKKFVNISVRTARTAMSLAAACAVVGVVVGVFSLTGISMTIARLIFQTANGVKIMTLVMTMLVAMVLGMGLPTSAAYVLSSISAAPALTMAGIDLLPAHLFVFYYSCMSTITPPVATGAYTAAGLSGGSPNKVGFLSMRLAMAGFIVPFIFIYQPDLLITEKSNMTIACITFFSTALGVVMLCAAIEGVFFRKLITIERVVFTAVAVALILPDTKISIIGFIASVIVIAYEYKTRNKVLAI